MRRPLICVVALLGLSPLLAASQPARHALVLGVGDPAHEEVPDDASKLITVLQRLKFSVITRSNPTAEEIKSALDEFKHQLSPGDVGAIFYIGHGSRVAGTDYLRPKDSGSDPNSVTKQWIPVDDLIHVLEDAPISTRLLFVDACRNNIFPDLPYLGEPNAVLKGTVISYAAAPGRIVPVPNGSVDAYVAALITYLPMAGLELSDLFKSISDYVSGASIGTQTTWINSSYSSAFYFQDPVLISAHLDSIDDELLLFVNGTVVMTSAVAPRDATFPVHVGINKIVVQIYNQHTFTGGVAYEDVDDALKQFGVALPAPITALLGPAIQGRKPEGWNYRLTLSGPGGPLTPKPLCGGEIDVVKNGPHHGHWFEVATADLVVDEANAGLSMKNLNQDIWKPLATANLFNCN